MNVTKGQNCFPEYPPIFASKDYGNIVMVGTDGYFYTRGDNVISCNNQKCQTAVEDGKHMGHGPLQAGDVIIRTDLKKTFKYTLGSDGALVCKELVAGSGIRVFSQIPDPYLEGDFVAPGDFWFKEDTAKLYFRYADNGGKPPAGCLIPKPGTGDQWIDIAGDFVYDDTVYEVGTFQEIGGLTDAKKGDIAVVEDIRATYKYSADLGKESTNWQRNWIEISAADTVHHIPTLAETININNVRRGDVCVVEDTNKTYKYSNGTWHELLAEGKNKIYAQITNPVSNNNVKEYEYWLKTDTAVMYIRFDNQWLNLSPAAPIDEIFVKDTLAEIKSIKTAKQGDIAIATVEYKTYKNSDGTPNGWTELIAEGRYKVYSQTTDPAPTFNVLPDQFWVNTATGVTYIRLADPQGDQWLSLAGSTPVDDIYKVDTFAEMQALSPVKQGDVCVVADENKTYKRSEHDWVELLTEGRYKVYSQIIDPVLDHAEVKPDEIWLKTDTAEAYIRFADPQGDQWVSLQGESIKHIDVYFQDNDPALVANNNVTVKDLWFSTTEGITYIRFPDVNDVTGDTKDAEQWVALSPDTITPPPFTWEVKDIAERDALVTNGKAKIGDLCVVKNARDTYVHQIKRNGEQWIRLLTDTVSGVQLFAQDTDPKDSKPGETIPKPYSLWFNTSSTDVHVKSKDSKGKTVKITIDKLSLYILNNTGTTNDVWEWHKV